MSERRENVLKPFTVQADGRASTQTIHLSKQGANEFTIII